MTGPQVLDTLAEKLIGNDLPILRKTAASIAALASTTRSDIGSIAQIILQDQPFTACVLRMANSAYYGRGAKGKVSSVTRAILLLGFSTIRDMAIAAEYADFAQSRIPRAIDLEQLIAKAFVTSRQAVLFARALNLPQADDLFVRSLFSRLGELTMAYYLPDGYSDIRKRMVSHARTYEAAHLDVLGIPYLDITRALAQRYGIPGSLVRTFPLSPDASRWTDDDRGDAAITIAGELSDDLFIAADKLDGERMEGIASKYAPRLNLSPSVVTSTVKAAFRQSRDFAGVFNIDPDKFELSKLDTAAPPGAAGVAPEAKGAGPAGDVTLKVIDLPEKPRGESAGRKDSPPVPSESGAVASLIGSGESTPASSPEGDSAEGMPAAPPDAGPPYLPLLMELSAHVLDQPDFNTVVTYLLEGLHRGCGFSHVALILPNHSTQTLTARFGVGPGTDERLPAFASPADAKANLLMRVMLERTPIRLRRGEPLEIPLPEALADFGGARAVALGPLHNGTRTIGLIWAGHARAIDDATWNAFQLFIMQANIALNRLAR